MTTPRDRLAALLGFPDAAWLVQHISDGRVIALVDEIEQGRAHKAERDAALAKIAEIRSSARRPSGEAHSQPDDPRDQPRPRLPERR